MLNIELYLPNDKQHKKGWVPELVYNNEVYAYSKYENNWFHFSNANNINIMIKADEIDLLLYADYINSFMKWYNGK